MNFLQQKFGGPKGENCHSTSHQGLRTVFPLTAFKNTPETQICPKFVPAIVLGGFQSGGLKFVKNLSKCARTCHFGQIFDKFQSPGLEPPQNNRWDKFWTNLGFGVFLNAVRVNLHCSFQGNSTRKAPSSQGTRCLESSGTKKNEHKPKLLSPDIFRCHPVGVLHVLGWGPKSSVCPSKPGKSNFLGGISRDFAGKTRRCPKSL